MLSEAPPSTSTDLSDFAGLRHAPTSALPAPINLEKYSDVAELHALGLDALKAECQRKVHSRRRRRRPLKRKRAHRLQLSRSVARRA